MLFLGYAGYNNANNRMQGNVILDTSSHVEICTPSTTRTIAYNIMTSANGAWPNLTMGPVPSSISYSNALKNTNNQKVIPAGTIGGRFTMASRAGRGSTA